MLLLFIGQTTQHSNQLIVKRVQSCGVLLSDTGSDGSVEDLSHLLEPLGLLNFAITISIEGAHHVGELFVHLSLGEDILVDDNVGATGLEDFSESDFTITIAVKVVEGLLGGGESLGAGGGDLLFLLVVKGVHLSSFYFLNI